MKKFSELFTKRASVELRKVIFDCSATSDEVIVTSYKDFYTYTIEDGKLVIEVCRQLISKSKDVLNFLASYKVIHPFLNENDGIDIEKKYDIDSEIKNNLEFFVPDEFDRLSLLISQITASFGSSPFVTVPFANFEESDSQHDAD